VNLRKVGIGDIIRNDRGLYVFLFATSIGKYIETSNRFFHLNYMEDDAPLRIVIFIELGLGIKLTYINDPIVRDELNKIFKGFVSLGINHGVS